MANSEGGAHALERPASCRITIWPTVRPATSGGVAGRGGEGMASRRPACTRQSRCWPARRCHSPLPFTIRDRRRHTMSEGRFTTLTPETMTPEQKKVVDAIQSGPRGAGLRGPFNALLRSPELCDLVQRVGAFVRFGSSIPARLNEMAIIMAGRKWTAQYEFYGPRRARLRSRVTPD